ncbi:bifunctional diguanylate cyclase/phosphodiesterase [Mycobacterium sp.]|uniref:putative bifunctional diguanylate cyclase/phosphodiesterase n=1 Tax=Mycobacterium sp. TaxID=1785 RepID=UPI0025DC0C7F|nr:bifunctional diguanylate cyclase/phosphodiesterase [Mycobacterium sp.]
MPRSLVTSVATQLMRATASTATQVSEQVLAQLVEKFDLDAAFLRHHDHSMRASVLVAEWPPRTDVPDPDPMAVVHFTSADPVLAQCEHGKKPVVIQPEPTNRALQRWFGGTKPAPASAVAAAPLVSGETTTGVLGMVKHGARKWKQDEINTLEAVAALFAQLQGRIAAEEKLRYLAEHDDLTGLYNRRALVAHLAERLAAGSPGPVAVLYLDLDRLKPINDYLGHTAGDWFIRVFAQRIRTCVGDQSMIARLGGDEFVVIPDTPMSTATAESFARRLGAMLRERLAIGGHMITRTVSIGLAVGIPGRDNSTDLLRRADEAVLTAKRGGGNQVALSTDDMALQSAFRNDIELHLQGDIDNEALLLHYLPEVDLRTGAIVAAEALVRWRHPIWGLLLPDSFIGVAESSNLAGTLGRWVMRTACAEFSRWRAKGVGQSAILRINVSPVQLITRGFVRSVAETIEEFGIDGGSVCLEITERAVVHDIETTRKTLADLKEVGVQIAIDDFGTGYAVLSHLKSLPVDMLKIDTGFVRDLGNSAGDLAIVRAIIGLAEAFGLQLVAEGVETPAAAMTLMQHGCYRAQGFLLSRPVPGSVMEALLAARWLPMEFLADRDALSLGAI